ncbi:DNA-entry nuclease [Bacillus sp. IB182487]|uniref:DNA-entry nuclease n=2 Tax=Metabacillus arenae TaxID=2771434 RepID=A0A926RZK5_9BACI|nr:DNA-entry nuclease [Metabacillus arenae]
MGCGQLVEPVSETTISPTNILKEDYDAILNFPSEKYPETAQHIEHAMEKQLSNICTIDRDGADQRREESLEGIPTKPGYDRDEWPMAMCEEGGAGASVRYVTPSDNRGAGAWVGNQVEDYPDGTRVLFIVE